MPADEKSRSKKSADPAGNFEKNPKTPVILSEARDLPGETSQKDPSPAPRAQDDGDLGGGEISQKNPPGKKIRAEGARPQPAGVSPDGEAPRRGEAGAPGGAPPEGGKSGESRVPPFEQKFRVQKILADRGIAARRKCENLIRAGKVTTAGRPIRVGESLPGDAPLEVDGRRVEPGARAATISAFFKPVGVLTSRGDPSGLPTIYELLPAPAKKLSYAGRLDFLTSGLLILTDSGEIIEKLTHPRHKIVKTYEITLTRKVSAADLERLARPIGLRGDDTRVKFDAVRQAAPRVIEVKIAEGRKRVVRRACAQMSVPLARLHRAAIGGLRLADLGLAVGKTRILTPAEIEKLFR